MVCQTCAVFGLDGLGGIIQAQFSQPWCYNNNNNLYFLLLKLFTKVHEPAVASSNLGVPDNLRVGNNFILSCTCLSICERLYFISHLTGYQLKKLHVGAFSSPLIARTFYLLPISIWRDIMKKRFFLKGNMDVILWLLFLFFQLHPIISDHNFLMEQHLLLAVKSADNDESYGNSSDEA